MKKRQKGPPRPDKIPDVLKAIRQHLEQGLYRYKAHCTTRMSQRGVIRVEVEHVLKHGLREERKDEFKEEFNTWNYAIRGKTLDRDKEIRIAVSFSSVEGLLIITAIDINRED